MADPNDINEVLKPSQPSSKPMNNYKVLLSGAVAGFAVDTSMYPLDTLKARLQSKEGFFKSGGFKRIYRGFPPMLAASIPNSCAFFLAYEFVKSQSQILGSSGHLLAFSNIIAAVCGEVSSCSIRVPFEVIKMRSQTSVKAKVSNLAIGRTIIKNDGPMGLYRGFTSTVLRDVPFSAIQYPVWEYMKKLHFKMNEKPANSAQSAFYGAIAGGLAAALTTPLDVAKTRIMLAERGDKLTKGSIPSAMQEVYRQKGIRGLFAGVVPRTVAISLGAAIFLGAYDEMTRLLR